MDKKTQYIGHEAGHHLVGLLAGMAVTLSEIYPTDNPGWGGATTFTGDYPASVYGLFCAAGAAGEMAAATLDGHPDGGFSNPNRVIVSGDVEMLVQAGGSVADWRGYYVSALKLIRDNLAAFDDILHHLKQRGRIGCSSSGAYLENRQRLPKLKAELAALGIDPARFPNNLTSSDMAKIHHHLWGPTGNATVWAIQPNQLPIEAIFNLKGEK